MLKGAEYETQIAHAVWGHASAVILFSRQPVSEIDLKILGQASIEEGAKEKQELESTTNGRWAPDSRLPTLKLIRKCGSAVHALSLYEPSRPLRFPGGPLSISTQGSSSVPL